MNWQPIDTAPKDGTPILGWDGEYMTTIQWVRFGTEWQLVCPGEYAEDYSFYPTYWLPLPEPPKD